MAKAPKVAKHATEPVVEKKPKSREPGIGGSLPLAWRFSNSDRTGPFAWSIESDEKYREVLEKLAEFEHKDWSEIIAGRSHPIAVADLSKEARDQLIEIKRDDVDELMSFRLTGTNRVWCVKVANIMSVLWWDEDHQVCPVAKDKADQAKARKRKGK